ncbi:MAG: carboxypeptidase-like regulatory domain-containing protein, partial [Prevotella sp.]|nr:carboxypeptidase-like regulatory domain-containing protein [Prevotella sp.]
LWHQDKKLTDMKKMMMLLLLSVACVALQAQQTTLSGIVTDAKSGNPIAQATVAMAGVSVVTNDDGMFTLKVKPAAGTLTVSHIGYRTVRVKVSDNHSAPVTVRLQPTAIQLKEVVVWNESRSSSRMSSTRLRHPSHIGREVYRHSILHDRHWCFIALRTSEEKHCLENYCYYIFCFLHDKLSELSCKGNTLLYFRQIFA